ncbi:MAG TPA: hypothetical protein DCM71_26205 [Runella sp.]|nr:hypothetical protein [Runella sp.]
MKIFLYILLFLAFVSCKDSDDQGTIPLNPNEPFGARYQVMLNYHIKVIDYANGYKSYWVEKGGNQAVVLFTLEPGADRTCCDNGSPFIAFEIDPNQPKFEYTTPQLLENAKANTGLTNSFAGPQSYGLKDGKVSGVKVTPKEWQITIDIPQKTNSFYNGMVVKGNFVEI